MPDTRSYAKGVTIKQQKSLGMKRKRYSRTGSQGIGGTGTWKKNPEASLKAYLASKYGDKDMEKNKVTHQSLLEKWG